MEFNRYTHNNDYKNTFLGIKYDSSSIGSTSNKIEFIKKNNERTPIIDENPILITLNQKKQNKVFVILDEDELILI